MKKFLAVIVVLLIAAGAFIQFLVPRALTNYIKGKVADATHAQEVTLSLDALPSAKIALGYVDKIHCTADDATIGDLELKQAVLDGSSIHIDIKELLMPTEGISREEHVNRILKSAGKSWLATATFIFKWITSTSKTLSCAASTLIISCTTST